MTPRPQHVRPKWRRHVTIVAGFKCYEGIVLCADTQETVAELSKRHVPKLLFEPKDQLGNPVYVHGDELAVAFCGAADNGPFVDRLVEEAWDVAKSGTNIEEVSDLIDGSIQRTYKRYGEIFQRGYCPSADLIFGVKMQGESKLFNATGPIVTEQQKFYSGGAGYYMADFLASRMYEDSLSLRQCVILAAYVLFQAKEHVDGCGGESQIAILRDDGISGMVDSLAIESINTMLGESDSSLGRLLLSSADLEMTDRQFSDLAEATKTMLERCRHAELPNYRTRKSIGKRVSVSCVTGLGIDGFGLPMPSTPEKSEGQREN